MVRMTGVEGLGVWFVGHWGWRVTVRNDTPCFEQLHALFDGMDIVACFSPGNHQLGLEPPLIWDLMIIEGFCYGLQLASLLTGVLRDVSKKLQLCVWMWELSQMSGLCKEHVLGVVEMDAHQSIPSIPRSAGR